MVFFSHTRTHAHIICTHLAIQSVLVEGRRGEVVVFGNIPGNEQLHLATSISQYLHQMVVWEKVKSDVCVNKWPLCDRWPSIENIQFVLGG